LMSTEFLRFASKLTPLNPPLSGGKFMLLP
jgi:hypothetical protein